MDRNEERTYERVTRSIRLMKSLIGDYSGRVMNVAGDGVLALFESAPEALRFAVAIQQELRNDVVWDAVPGADHPAELAAELGRMTPQQLAEINRCDLCWELIPDCRCKRRAERAK